MTKNPSYLCKLEIVNAVSILGFLNFINRFCKSVVVPIFLFAPGRSFLLFHSVIPRIRETTTSPICSSVGSGIPIHCPSFIGPFDMTIPSWLSESKDVMSSLKTQIWNWIYNEYSLLPFPFFICFPQHVIKMEASELQLLHITASPCHEVV